MDSKGQEVAAMAGFTEQTTNNRAEYMALVAGLRCAAAMGIKKLEIEGCGAVRSGYELSSPPGVAVAPVRCQVSYTCPRFARRDSKLVVEQLKGKWQCNQHGLSVLRDEAQALMGRFDSASIRHVPRCHLGHHVTNVTTSPAWPLFPLLTKTLRFQRTQSSEYACGRA